MSEVSSRTRSESMKLNLLSSFPTEVRLTSSEVPPPTVLPARDLGVGGATSQAKM